MTSCGGVTGNAGPLIGILAWEQGSDGQLSQLEELKGNILHADTFGFPLLCRRVPGASFQTVVREPRQALLEAMINASKELEELGVSGITTSCGFNALFQREVSAAVRVPFFSSPLLLVPLALASLGGADAVGVITADARYLRREHLEAVGIRETERVVTVGLEESREFTRVLDDPNARLETSRLEAEVVELAVRLVRSHPRIGAIVLECTDLPPFSAAIRQATRLVTLDAVTLVNLLHAGLVS
jgi:hypothetical protein